jgi:hypothetical protein
MEDIMAGRTTPETPDPHERRYGPVDPITGPSFDWIEQPIAAVADAFFDLITRRRRHRREDDGPEAHRGPPKPGV